MMGEELNSSYITERELVGDRTYAVVDKQTGKVASAKNPRKWGSRSIFVDSPREVDVSHQSESLFQMAPTFYPVIIITRKKTISILACLKLKSI
jgi:uncharacterized protein YcbX